MIKHDYCINIKTKTQCLLEENPKGNPSVHPKEPPKKGPANKPSISHTGYFCMAWSSRRPKAGKKIFFGVSWKNTKNTNTYSLYFSYKDFGIFVKCSKIYENRWGWNLRFSDFRAAFGRPPPKQNNPVGHTADDATRPHHPKQYNPNLHKK